MDKILGFVKENKKALGKGAMIVGGGIAVAVLTKLGLQPVEEDYDDTNNDEIYVIEPEENVDVIEAESEDEQSFLFNFLKKRKGILKWKH